MSEYYQPTEEQCEKHGILSFEVWTSIENGREYYPMIPESDWIELHEDDVEHASVVA